MSTAPEPFLSACLEVLYIASLEARRLGWVGGSEGLSPKQAQQLADLMDAVHNIPHLITRWELCDENLLRHCLKEYDQKWGPEARHKLLNTYDQKLDSPH